MSLKRLVNSVYKMLLPSIRSAVTFTATCNTRGRDWVIGDEHRIQQVLTNVVTNAIKYTIQGSIELIVTWQNDRIQFDCIDTGPGIPKGEQEELFQRFTKRGGAPGTGLGLAIAKHLVDLSGGTIWFDSDPTMNAGTTCSVQLPLATCDPPGQLQEDPGGSGVIEEKLAILIIDDIKMNRMMLKRRILKGIAPNASILEAATGEEALKICAQQKCDILIVDQFMEEAGGVLLGTDTVIALRRMKIESLIIGCSGNDLEAEFKEAGADSMWKKPMPPNAQIIQLWRTFIAQHGRFTLE